MAILESTIATGSAAYKANRDGMLALITRMRALEDRTRAASAAARDRFHKRGQLLPRERVLSEGIHSDRAFEEGIMTDLDRGVVDIVAFLSVLRETGYDGPLVVEQDLALNHPDTPETIARRNHDFVSKLLVNGAGA